MAADPGEVEFTPGGPTVYLPDAPTIDWFAYGALTGATCQFSKLSPSASTPFPTTSCDAAVANAPGVNTDSAPTFTHYSWPLASMTTGDGAYRVTYTPTFAAFPSLVATRDFVIDTVDPVLTASAPTGVTADNTPQISYLAQDANLDRTECAVDPIDPMDPAEYSVCPASPFSLPTLADGEHKLYIVAYDKIGRLDVEVKVFTVDATGPTITVTGLTEGSTVTNGWPPFSVGSSDAGTGVRSTTCAWDSTTPTACDNSLFLNTPLADGARTLSVVSTDVAGNVSTQTIRFTVRVPGRWKAGLAAPKKASFAIKRGRLTVTFALPAGSTATTCSGRATISAKLKKKQVGSASAKFTRSGSKCVATARPRLSKKLKGKKLALTIDYESGPIKPFTLRGSGKL